VIQIFELDREAGSQRLNDANLHTFKTWECESTRRATECASFTPPKRDLEPSDVSWHDPRIPEDMEICLQDSVGRFH